MNLLQFFLKQFPYDPNQKLYIAIFSFITIFLVLKLITTRRNSSINLPPSPPKLPIIGNLHQIGTLPHRSFHALSKKYGPLMLLQLGQTPTLVVSSADVVKEIIKNHDVVFSSRPQSTAAKILLYECQDIGFAPYGEEWKQKRKICVLEILSPKRVKSFRSIREDEVAELVGNILKACEKTGSSVNLSERLIATSNNIMARCILGPKYDTKSDGSSDFGELGRKLMRQLAVFCVRDYFPSLGWIDNLTGLIGEFKATFAAIDAFFDEVIAQHKRMVKKDDDDESDCKDFVDIFLQLQKKGMLDFELSEDSLKAILMDMFVGASDTTSATLEWAFAELIRNPNSMKKVQEEIRRVVGIKPKVNENDVNQMNYLKCVVKETLRLHPPFTLLVPRETTSSVEIRGYNIPSKTMVYLNAWAIQRDPELWKNPEEFVPERFETSKVDMKGHDFQLIPFGTGRRGCPGISFGLGSTEYVLANLLYWFDWKIPNNEGVPMQDMEMSETFGLTVSKKNPIFLEPVPYSFGLKPSYNS